MNSLLNISLLLLASLTSAASVDAQLWLQAQHPEHAWGQHHWETTTDHHLLLQQRVKLARMALPAEMKPFNDVMVMFKATGYRTPEEARKILKEAPRRVPRTLINAVLSLPPIDAAHIPKDSLTERLHPAMRFAREVGLDHALLESLKTLRMAEDCAPEIAQLSASYAKMAESVNLLSSGSTALQSTLGLLTSYYQMKAQTTAVPSVPVLNAFLSENQGSLSAIDIFVKSLTTSELAAVKQAVETFFPPVDTYVRGPFRSPKYIQQRHAALLHAVEAHMAGDVEIQKHHAELLALQQRMQDFENKFNNVRGRFNLPPTVGFRPFMKQFDALLMVLRAGLERAGVQLTLVNWPPQPTKTVPVDAQGKPIQQAGAVVATDPITGLPVPAADHVESKDAAKKLQEAAHVAAPKLADGAIVGGKDGVVGGPAQAVNAAAAAAASGNVNAAAPAVGGAVNAPVAGHDVNGNPIDAKGNVIAGATHGAPGAASAAALVNDMHPGAVAGGAAISPVNVALKEQAAKEAALKAQQAQLPVNNSAKQSQLAAIKAQLQALGDAIHALTVMFASLKASVDAFEL